MAKLSGKYSALDIGRDFLDDIIAVALVEDRVDDDITSSLLFGVDSCARAAIVAKEKCIIAGLDVVHRTFLMLDKKIKFKSFARDGNLVKRGERVARIEGSLKSILKGERTALNFLMRLSGIATLTHRFVSCIYPYKVKIMDTRKTTPGLRALEKYAVRAGGGVNHRMNMADGVLIKDNHLAKVKNKKLEVKSLVQEIRRKIPKGMKIEIETDNLKEFREVLEAGADIIMLDNMSGRDIKKAVFLRNQNPKYRNQEIEASGGINLKNVRSIAASGVERISIGSLTHSYRSPDFSLEFVG